MAQNLKSAIARSFAIVRGFLNSEARGRAWLWFGLLLTVLLSMSGLNVLNSYVGRDFVTAISERDSHRYVLLALKYAAVFAASTVGTVLARFSEERLRLLWREWLTGELMDRYLADRTFYRLKAREEIDNPDQRITEDVKAYTQTTLSFSLLTINATITSVAFLGVLWSITPTLVLVAVLYSAFGTFATIGLGRSLARLDHQQLKKEADLRYQLIRVREAAETLAVTGGERAERTRLGDRLAALVTNNRKIIGVTRNVGFFTNAYNYGIQLVPLLIVAPIYMRGEVEFGVVTQSAMAFAQVLGAFSLVVTQFESLSSFAAVTGRLGAIFDAIDHAAEHEAESVSIASADDRVAFEALRLCTPKGKRTLVEGLTLTVPQGGGLLITGPNGPAASALFLATAGVWECGAGQILRPSADGIRFVPRQSHEDAGTLRQRLARDLPADRPPTDQDLQDAIDRAGFRSAANRLGGLDTPQVWTDALSMADQHLLDLAGLLLSRPRFVFLERINGDLGPDQLNRFYQALKDADITPLSLGEPNDLLVYHETILVLRENGRWRTGPTRDEPGASRV